MKNTTAILALTLGLSFLGTACGVSPQLNHTYPKRNVASIAELNEQTGEFQLANPEGCQLYFKTQNMCATLSWVSEPTHDAAGLFRLYFWNKDQGLAQQPFMEDPDADKIEVKLWMPDMGHGSGLVKVLKAKDETGEALEGTFEASDVYFVMPGKWDIIVQFKDAQGNVTDSSKINYQSN